MYSFLIILTVFKLALSESNQTLPPDEKLKIDEQDSITQQTPFHVGPIVLPNLTSVAEKQRERVRNAITGAKQKNSILASIQVGDSYNTDNFTHRCCGALVTANVVISVGNCVHDQYGNFILEPASYRIVIGTEFFSDVPKLQYVSKVVLHRRYIKENKLNDLSMFKLKQPQEIPLVDLVSLRSENLPAPINCSYYAWVYTGIEILGKRHIFTSFHVDMEDTADCIYELGMNQNYLTPLHKCFIAPSIRKTACLYNPGAPILCQGILFGLHSYSFPSQQSEIIGRTGVYLDVGKYIDTIEDFAQSRGIKWSLWSRRKECAVIVSYLFIFTGIFF